MSKLRKWREDRGLTQMDLAAAARVPRYKIQLVEQEIAILNDFEFERIAYVLRLPELLKKELEAMIERGAE